MYVAAYFTMQCAAISKLHQKRFYTVGDTHSEPSAMSECGRLRCVCEHVIDCNRSLTNSKRCYTFETTPERNALTYTRAIAWFRTALKCPSGYMPLRILWIHCHCRNCGYIATGAAKIRDNGDMCLLLTTSLFLLFVHEEKKMLTSGADISHFFKKKKRITMLESLIFLKEKKNYNADIWS